MGRIMIENEVARRTYHYMSIWAFIFSLTPILAYILTVISMFFDIPKQIIEPWRVINLCIIFLMPILSIIISVVSIVTIQRHPDRYHGVWLCTAAILISIAAFLFSILGFYVTRGAHKGPSLLK
jgi:cytochrome bd-type quinol oxidase subunit 2